VSPETVAAELAAIDPLAVHPAWRDLVDWRVRTRPKCCVAAN
jgi:hypothetical protein